MRNLSELLHLHDDLDGMFFEHQAALLRFDFNKALSLLKSYESALLIHMKDEEDILMSIYKERAADIRGGAAGLFLMDHEKMRAWLMLFKTEIASLAVETKPEAELIRLLDREAFYKRLCSHHDKRETDIFYPEMDRVTTVAEKQELLSRVTCSFLTAAAV